MPKKGTSWVRDLVKTKISNTPKVAQLVVSDKETLESDGPYAVYFDTQYSEFEDAVGSLFGSKEAARATMGSAAFDQTVADIWWTGLMSADDSVMHWPLDYEKDACESYALTIFMFPCEFNVRDHSTNNVNKELGFIFAIHQPGLVYKDGSGMKKHEANHALGGFYCPSSSTVVVDLSGCDGTSCSLYHELEHYMIRQLRTLGRLDDIMYGSGADRREEICVHFDTDLHYLKDAIYERFAKIKIEEDGDFNAKSMVQPSVQFFYDENDDSGCSDSLKFDGKVKSDLSNRASHIIKPVSTQVYKSKNQAWRGRLSSRRKCNSLQSFVNNNYDSVELTTKLEMVRAKAIRNTSRSRDKQNQIRKEDNNQ